MRLLDQPVTFPHVTVLGNSGRCVNIGVLELGGDVYIGDAELRLAGPLLGWVPTEEVERMKLRILALEGELQQSLNVVARIRQETVGVPAA